ncbi:MFS general substrate transporter [Punctularia strigosozonata HHB-11173 SS5]|uniref:MFS general substrate transporter n=1 Tax=Punctularia strigosozonata (strain HHB-11173) TaxID=741275 RepID=UPI0004418401|nr:MFS general substrate transporter [Punctularia strigosozonata HHB-11173 SS5]EIN12276.1 MFS general substrate transporter [Punctularia strigosozonata HHB-11173 SS5]
MLTAPRPTLQVDSAKRNLEDAAPSNIDIDEKGEIDQETNQEDHGAHRRLVLKIDLLLMPLLTISYGLQFYDKFVFSSAAVFGMLADLDLTTPVPGTTKVSTQRYSNATAAFYWGYMVGVLPMSLLLQRFPVAKTLGLLIFLWGVVVMLTVLVSSYPGAVAIRFFLGVIESSVSPGFVLVTSMWYTKDELPVRVGIWYSATGLFTVFSGVMNYAIGHAHGSLAPWKYMYLLAGSATIVWSLIILAVLPDSPASSHRWFNEEERSTLLLREKEKPSGVDSRRLRLDQALEAAKDVKVWIMAVMGAAIYVCNGGVTAFGSIIIKSFGYSSLRAILLQAPGGATTCVSIYLSTWLAERIRNARTILLALTCLPVMVGALVIWLGSWSHRGLPLFGYYLLPIFGAPYVLLLSIAATNVGGETKKACTIGAIFVGYNVGNIIGPYLVNTDEADVKYRTTWVSIIVVMALTIIAAMALRILWARENKRRRHHDEPCIRARTPSDGENPRVLPRDYSDLTDWQDRCFLYVL